MCPIAVQPNANVYSNIPRKHCDVHHLVDFPPLMFDSRQYSVANVSHSASMTHIHACIILLLILIHSMPHTILVGNCGNSYNVWLLIDESHFILLHSALKLKKSQRSNFSKCFPLVLRFFLPPRQDIASLAYLDDFRQVQAIWLHETRQEGLSAPSPDCKEKFSVRTLSGIHHYSRRGRFSCCTLSHFASSCQREKCSLVSIETLVSFVQ